MKKTIIEGKNPVEKANKKTPKQDKIKQLQIIYFQWNLLTKTFYNKAPIQSTI